jgi:hypothetical protein
VREANCHQKLFIIISPYGSNERVLGMPLRAAIANRLRRIKPDAWSAFVAMMDGEKYTLPIDPPQPGTVLGFDVERRATVITVGARTAREYVDAIRQAIRFG